MLVLSRKLDQTLVFNVTTPGTITVRVVRLQNKSVRLGIEAPKEAVSVVRGELLERQNEVALVE